MSKIWDCNNRVNIISPDNLKEFFKDIELVCQKHGYSISHEDEHGAFIIEEFNYDNIRWLKSAHWGVKETNSNGEV